MIGQNVIEEIEPVIRATIAKNLTRFMHRSVRCRNQPELATKSGVSQKTISRILNEEASIGVDVIEKLAHALGRETYEFFLDDSASSSISKEYSSEELLDLILDRMDEWTDEEFMELIGAMKAYRRRKTKDQ